MKIVDLLEERYNHKVYHGSNAKFNRFDQGQSRIVNDFYGGGVAYFTDNIDVAKTYANSMFKSKGGGKFIYEVELSLENVFDVDHEFTGNELTKFYDDRSVEDFARGAGLMKFGTDKYTVLGNLRSGDISLTGDQIFKGLSRGMNQTAKARQLLISLGYDGLRYNGGVNMAMATKHSVFLAYNADDIKIIKTYSMVTKAGK